MTLLNQVKTLFQRETVFCVSLVLAVLSALAPYLLLLALCLLVVFRVVGFVPVLLCVAAVVLAVNRRLFRSVDYFLLLTFLCFFIFIGNLKRIPALNDLLLSLVGGHELLAGVLASQVISNVPAAILLSGFTQNFAALLTAVNLGGLGTLVASLAIVAASVLFSWFIGLSSRYALVYGSLASLIILLVWLYLCGNILILGDVFNCVWYRRRLDQT